MNVTHLSVDLILQFVSSLIMFIAMIACVECMLYLFRFNPRQRVLLRLIPLLKIPFDFILFKIPNYDFLYHLNPLNCQSYFQQWIMAQIPDHIKLAWGGSLHPSVSKILTLQVSPLWLESVCGLILLISAFRLGYKISQFFSSAKYIKSIYQSSTPCIRPIFNSALIYNLNSHKVSLLCSDAVAIPFSTQNHLIILPSSLMKDLSQGEFEAVIAHELGHLRYQDSKIKIITEFICAFFWWLPTRRWLKKLDDDQEQASDQSIRGYGLDPIALASAVVKVISQSHLTSNKEWAVCQLVNRKQMTLRRLQSLLNEPMNHPKPATFLLSFGFITLLFLFLRFWFC